MVAEVDAREPAAAQRAGALVLDVREPSEYEGGHVPGAKLVPLGGLPARIDELPRHEPIYLCDLRQR